jgi:hypothetical protein
MKILKHTKCTLKQAVPCTSSQLFTLCTVPAYKQVWTLFDPKGSRPARLSECAAPGGGGGGSNCVTVKFVYFRMLIF